MTPTNFFTINSGIVCLCGSTRFFEETMECNRLLTFKRWVVLSVGSFGHSYHKHVETNTDYVVVKKLHYSKILMSDAIVVVSDCTGYMGDSTRAEIAFAARFDKPIFTYDGADFNDMYQPRSMPFDSLTMYRSVVDFYEQAYPNSLGLS
jgi:hypothetical protein